MRGVYIILLEQTGREEFRAQITNHGRDNDFVGTGKTPALALQRAWISFIAWRRLNGKRFRLHRAQIDRT